MRSIEIIFVVFFTVVLNSISVVNSQEGGGVAFEAPPGQSSIQAEELPMGLIEDYEDDTLVDKKYLDKAQKKQLDSNIVGKARVIDGDTITINNVKIRFSGIDAPEKNYYGQTQFCKGPKGVWACGKKASSKLKKLINGQEVQCTNEGKIDTEEHSVSVMPMGWTCRRKWFDLEWL